MRIPFVEAFFYGRRISNLVQGILKLIEKSQFFFVYYGRATVFLYVIKSISELKLLSVSV